MGVEGVVVDRRAVGEGREAVADVDATADQPQFFEMFEGPLHGPLLGAQLRGVTFVGLAPFTLEGHALPEAVGRQLFVAVVGIFGREAVDVVALGLIAASGKVAKIVGVVDVILQRAVRLEREMAGNDPADRVAASVRQADDPQPLSVGVGVFAQEGEDRAEVALADGLHVTDALAAVDLEADHQESADLGPRAVEHCLPAVHVGEGEVAVADARGHGITLDDRPVFKAHGFEFNHLPYSSFSRYGCNTAGPAPGNSVPDCRRPGWPGIPAHSCPNRRARLRLLRSARGTVRRS